MRWHLLIEEFGPTITYVKGQHNLVTDALSRMNRIDFSDNHTTNTIHHYAECFGINDLPNDTFPLTYELIDWEQQKDPQLLLSLHNNKYTLNAFCGGNIKRTFLICHDGKIVIPSTLRQHIVKWYHTYLLHPGLTRMEETIQQHLTCPNLREDVGCHVSTCPVCQKNKKQTKKYGHLPAKEAEGTPGNVYV